METEPRRVSRCPDCERTYPECTCGEDDIDEDYDPREDWPLCGCQYCFCHVQTEDGGPCSDCLNHAHQG